MVKINIKKPRILLMLAAMVALNAAYMSAAFASTMTKPSVVFTSMINSGGSSLVIDFTTSASNTGTGGQLAFSGWTGSGGTGTVAASPAVSSTYNGANCTTMFTGSADLPGVGSATAAGTAATGTIVITDSTALVASTQYCYVITNGVSANPTSTGQGTVNLTEGTDSAIAVEFDIIGSDQVTVGATVPPSFTFSINNTTDNFSPLALSTSTIGATGGVTCTVNTNAKNGWMLYGSDLNTGLKSTVQNYTIGSGNSVGSVAPGVNTTLTNNHEGYVTAVPAASISQGSGAGVTSGSAVFASTASGQGAGLNTTEQQLASSTGTANTATVLVKEYATISPTTPAATDFSDTITLVAAGSF